MTKAPPRLATYRLQLTPAFGFDAAANLTGYLARLGISHLYLSPIFEARPGSSHGYDQTDPGRIREEFGGPRGFERLVRAAHAAGLGVILDIVPNHMAAHHDNPWWFGMLRTGPGAEFDRFFDVDWESGGGRIVLPVLGAPLGELLSRGALEIVSIAARGTCLQYGQRLFPLRPDVTADEAAGARLEALLDAQHYRLAYWRDGLREINYRRFFDVADLAALRVEDRAVFDQSHALTLELVSRGWIDGVRVDHVDGLLDPLEYLRRLRVALDQAAPGADRPLILVEKILASDETLPPDWPVDGTTGYDFLAAASALAVDPVGLVELRRHAAQRLAAPDAFDDLAIACKQEVAASLLGPELDRLCRLAAACFREGGVAFVPDVLRSGIVALSACLRVYRTYADASGMSPGDAARVHAAAQRAVSRDPTLSASPTLADLVEMLTLRGRFSAATPRDAALRALRSWQQFTGPLAAKGVEDTALYRDVACPALCDVGSEPAPSDAVPRMRSVAADRCRWRASLNATDTHDAKRSEDVRARLAVLSRVPRDWTALLDELIPRLRSALSSELPDPPSPRDLALILHAVFALWPDAGAVDPDLPDRWTAYATKAVRETRQQSSWMEPRADYERACARAIELLFHSPAFAPARARIAWLAASTRPAAARRSLGLVVLKALLPGLPDWYQGAETRVVALVDPDNRRAVDFTARRALLATVAGAWEADPAGAAARFLDSPDSDAAKLFVTWRSLAVRRRLLAAGAELTLQALTASALGWECQVRAGSKVCAAAVELDPSPAGDRAAVPDGVDQLSGRPAADSPHWLRLVVAADSTLHAPLAAPRGP